MAGSTLKQGTGKELKRLLAMLTSAIGETLGSLVGRELVVRPGEVALLDAEALVGGLSKPCAVARGALDKGFAGKTLYALFEAPDAIAMAGMLMMTPDDVIQQRRAKGTIEGEDAEAFGELGNVLCSGMGNVLRENVPNIDIRLHDHGVVKPGIDKDNLLGTGPLVALAFRLKVGDYPESGGYLITDVQTAEAWNKAPLETVGGEEPAAAAAGAAPPKPTGTGLRADEEGLQDIPAAPIRGTLAAFVTSPEVFRVLRRSCRRVGLELRRHGKGEIPNPAAHKNELVLLDLPPGEDRRFEWCRRIKEFGSTTKVVLLLHHPSRNRVTQAFLSRADAIIGFPCEEPQLSQKLNPLLADLPAPAAPTPPPATYGADGLPGSPGAGERRWSLQSEITTIHGVPPADPDREPRKASAPSGALAAGPFGRQQSPDLLLRAARGVQDRPQRLDVLGQAGIAGQFGLDLDRAEQVVDAVDEVLERRTAHGRQG